MQIIQSFYINPYVIEIITDDDKENMYYIPNEKLNKFDLVKIVLSNQTMSIKLFDDILQEGLIPFLAVLERLESGRNKLIHITPGNAGAAYNNYLFDTYDTSNENLKKYLVWSDLAVSTFLYASENTFFLEIAPIYPWFSYDPEDDPHYIPFEEYMKSYKPNIAIEISHDTIQTWITQCKQVMEKVT